MNQNKGVLVFSEDADLTLEILGKGRELADKLQAELAVLAIGSNAQQEAKEFTRYGADKVHTVENSALERFTFEPYLEVLYKLAVNSEPEIVLIGSTRNGKPVAAGLAMRLGTGCIPDCISLNLDAERRLVGERVTYGGNAIAKIAFKTKPQIATVPARAFNKPAPNERHGQILGFEAQIPQAKVQITEEKPFQASSIRIEEAETIISCGRGLEKKEDMKLLDDTSKVLCGQVGCSRPLAEDRKWFSEWIGLSGHKVRPKLYIACGISGVIQHVAGIRDAKIVVAINKDPEAPIFEVADYGVVGNLYEILPALKDALQKQLQ
jgi:electron transfer flavoprotein alpha subunit